MKAPTVSLFILLLTIFANGASAQTYRYIDDGGNINFAEHAWQVPERYRPQLVKPTPTVYMSEKERRRVEKMAKYEAKRRAKEEQGKIKKGKKSGKSSKEKGAKPSKGSGTVTKPGKDEEVVILYTSPSCQECIKLEQFFKEQRIRYKKFDIVRSQKAFDAFDKLGAGDKLPVCEVGDVVVKGFSPSAVLKELGRTAAEAPQGKGRNARSDGIAGL